jgi:DNA-binding CsgD family transcriptional regulator
MLDQSPRCWSDGSVDASRRESALGDRERKHDASYGVDIAIDVAHLPAEAQKLGDLSALERAVLALVFDGLGSREIARRLEITESSVYLTIADLLRALEFAPPGSGADDIHARAGTRPASPAEIERFHEQLGPFARDDEG